MTDRRELDRDLDRLLRDSGARVDMVSAREILRGVLASPAAGDDEAWLSLIAPDDNDVIDALKELNTRIQTTLMDDGLSRKTTDPERVAELRKEMKRRDLDVFIVPKADEHQGEFVAKRSERLQWLTAFTGSAGTCARSTPWRRAPRRARAAGPWPSARRRRCLWPWPWLWAPARWPYQHALRGRFSAATFSMS